MTAPPASDRKPPFSPYTPLQAAAEDTFGAAASTRTDTAASLPSSDNARTAREVRDFNPDTGEAFSLSAEVGRLESLKGALFGALQSSPSAALPLVDLATTYSNLLKLQLTLLPPTKAPAACADASPRAQPHPYKR